MIFSGLGMDAAAADWIGCSTVMPGSSHDPSTHVLARLAALAPLAGTAPDAVRRAAANALMIRAHRELVDRAGPRGQGPWAGRTLVLAGWGAMVRGFHDGRRQILTVILPGDVIAWGDEDDRGAVTQFVAITDMAVCRAPVPQDGDDGLARAYARSAALLNGQLLRQVARLGRLSAQDRLIDWLLDLNDRLALAGLADNGGFPLPLTQEMIADVLGLTSVHVNRTLQSLRKEGLVERSAGRIRLADPARLARLVDYTPALPRVSPAARAGAA